MIPYMLITPQEFIKIFTFKYSLLRYLFVFSWYVILSIIIFGIYYYQLWIFAGPLGKKLWKVNLFWDINGNISIFMGMLVFIFSYIFKSIVFKLPTVLTKEDVMEEGFKNNIAILIACHNSSDIIEETLKSIVVHFDPQHVFVCDNNKTSDMGENEIETHRLCETNGVNYNYINVPNKTNAIRTVLKEIKHHYEYVILLDDDTLMADTFCLKEDWFLKDKKLAGIGFGIRMKHTTSLLQRCVDAEYLYWSYNKHMKNFATNKFICGIGGIWKTDIIYDILSINPSDGSIFPFGEDGWNGTISRLNGYKIRQDMQNFVYSQCPTNLLFNSSDDCISGYDSTTLWKQRALRWYRSCNMRIIPELYSFLTFNASIEGDSMTKKILRNIYYRGIITWSFVLIYYSAIMPLLLANYIFEPRLYLVIHSTLILMTIISGLFVRYIIFRNRGDCHIGFDVIFAYPFYIMYVTIMKMFGFIGTLFYYFPFKIQMRVFGRHQLITEPIDDIPTDIESDTIFYDFRSIDEITPLSESETVFYEFESISNISRELQMEVVVSQ